MLRISLTSISLVVLLFCGGATQTDSHPTGQRPSSGLRSAATEQLSLVYRALTQGVDVPGLRIEQANDTLAWGQFWPNAKFEIITRHDTTFLPVAAYGAESSCAELEMYSADYPPVVAYRPALTYMVPVAELPGLIALECVTGFGGTGLELLTVGRRSGHPTYVGTLDEDLAAGDIRLHLQTIREYSDGGYVVEGTINIDSGSSAVRISTRVTHPSVGAPEVIAPAGGMLSFPPPADSFSLVVDGERYGITLDADSIHVRPTRVYHDVLITTQTTPRLAPNSFGLVFDTTVLFEGYEHIRVPYREGYQTVSRPERDSIMAELRRLGADFYLMPYMMRPGLRRWDVHLKDSVNLLVDTRVRQESGQRLWRPTLFFEYAGDRDAVARVHHAWAGRNGGIELIWIRAAE